MIIGVTPAEEVEIRKEQLDEHHICVLACLIDGFEDFLADWTRDDFFTMEDHLNNWVIDSRNDPRVRFTKACFDHIKDIAGRKNIKMVIIGAEGADQTENMMCNFFEYVVKNLGRLMDERIVEYGQNGDLSAFLTLEDWVDSLELELGWTMEDKNLIKTSFECLKDWNMRGVF